MAGWRCRHIEPNRIRVEPETSDGVEKASWIAIGADISTFGGQSVIERFIAASRKLRRVSAVLCKNRGNLNVDNGEHRSCIINGQWESESLGGILVPLWRMPNDTFECRIQIDISLGHS